MMKQCSQDSIQKEMSFLGFGNYRVSEDGTFLQCDKEAKKIFGIPEDETDVAEYSITDFYVVPSERESRLKQLDENRCTPIQDVLPMRINGQYKNLFNICWCCSENEKKCYVGIVMEIVSCTLSPQIFESFPVALYEVDENDKIVHANQKLIEMLHYQNEEHLLGKGFSELCEDSKVLEKINDDIQRNGYANEILKLKDAHSSTIKVECFSQPISEKERFGMLTIVTRREQYYNAMENMPTGYFHIENNRITHCNEHFVQLMGYKSKNEAIGTRAEKNFIDINAPDEYIKDLSEADRRGKPLQNYEVLTKKRNSDQIITISIDSQLVKDERGNPIGREGTIRDVSEKVKLQKKVKQAEENLKKTTADINSLTHTFLHPVVKFSGNAELQHQMGKVLHQTIQPKIRVNTKNQEETRQLGEKLLDRITKIIEYLPDSDDPLPYKRHENESSKKTPISIPIRDFKRQMKKISFMFDYSLKSLESDILLDGAIRDTVLRLLEELNKYDFSGNEILRLVISGEFLEFLQNILFNYLTRGALLQMKETEIMKRKVESLRSFIGLKKERTLGFIKYDLGIILEENLERFRPVLLEKGIEINYKRSGNLTAMVSPNDIDRIICSLLHNAGKYSFHRSGSVKVKARELGNVNMVEISIESYGIPIKQEELDNDSIFRFGMRGELAFASDRDGSGVGLADSKDIIDAHNGEIRISSRPAREGSDPSLQYNVPYLTNVTIRIPRTQKKIEKE